jgi:hypothetical protein
VFGSLALLLLLGTYIVSTEPRDALTASSPEVIMAVEPHSHEIAGQDRDRDREAVLVTLATYRE